MVYFGQINEERLPVEYIEKIVQRGFAIDLFGSFESASEAYKDYIAKNISVEYRGEFNAAEIQSKLVQYKYSLICIESERSNIRFCCPNKLFQSLSVGVPCIVSNCLKEIIIRFKDKYVIDFESFLADDIYFCNEVASAIQTVVSKTKKN